MFEDSKHIMSLAKDTYENEKTAQELLKTRQKEQLHSAVQELKRMTLSRAMWDILEIQINLEDIEDFRGFPCIVVENVRFIYDARFECPTPIFSGRLTEVWADEGLRIWGECNKYNGYNFPCGIKGLSKRIRSHHDLGKILSEGVKVDHCCRDPFADYW